MASFGRVLDQIIGHEDIKEHFTNLILNDHLHHCNLLSGPEGIGKKQLAIGFAQELLCEEKKDQKACGFCPHCLRAGKLQHESVLFIEPEGQSIKIDKAKEVQRFFQLNRIGRARIVIIDQVEKMNPQAANSLLKTFEEPPEETYFFLISGNQHKLLSTIRSRAQLCRVKPISLKLLESKSYAEKWQIHASQGSFAELKKWREESQVEFRKEFIDWVNNLDKSSFADLKTNTSGFSKDKDKFIDSLGFLQQILRDAICHNTNPDSVKFFPDQKEFIGKIAKIGPEGLQKLYDLCFNIELDLNINIDRQLHLESFSFQFKRLLNINP